MPSDPKKRQKKLERRSAKRKEKRHDMVRAQSAGLAERLTAAAHFPILDCTVANTLRAEGLGWVLLSRLLPDGQVAVASFLVDRYCLGVKNVFAEVVGRFSYDSKYVRKMASQMPSHPVPPEDARKLLEGAVAYARSLGFAPHPEYARAMRLFGSINAAESRAEFEFGNEGKPLFIAGPNETLRRSREIVAILAKHCGEGKFDYIVPVGGSHTVAEPASDLLDDDDGLEPTDDDDA